MAVGTCVILAFLISGATAASNITFEPYNETAALMFDEEDHDGDGMMSANESSAAFFKFDYNGDYRIQRNEYICFQITDHPELGSFANAIFDEYDYNNDHVLEESDLLHFYNSMDANGDSIVQKQEFIDFWVKIFTKHEDYILHGSLHPANSPHACDYVNVAFNFRPYEEYATLMFVSEDEDHDGQLSISEAVHTFSHYDANGDNRITRVEYACYQRSMHPGLGSFAHALFDEYDSDDDNYLDDHDIRHFYGQMDLDGNSLVGQVEFVTFWKKLFKKYENYHLGGAHHHANNHQCTQA